MLVTAGPDRRPALIHFAATDISETARRDALRCLSEH